MPPSPLLILNAGGLRSLVATAAAMSDPDHRHTVLLHLLGNDGAAEARKRHAQRIANHYTTGELITLPVPLLLTRRSAKAAGQTADSALPRARLLTTAIAQAVAIDAERVIWPVQANADADAAAVVIEQTAIAQHMAELDQRPCPPVETPLLELTDKQLIELGGQLGVPWEHSWSCRVQSNHACQACLACMRRRRAFEAAGVTDPADRLAAAR